MFYEVGGDREGSMSNTYSTGAHTPPSPPPPPSWRSAIFSSATDYSTQCVDRLRPGATRSAYRSVCFALKVSRVEKTLKKNTKKYQTLRTSDGGMTTTSVPVCGSPSPRKDPKDAAAALQPAERTPAPGLAAAARRGSALCRLCQLRPSR